MATNEELQEYYADLLILQYRGKEKAYDTIKAVAKQLVLNQLPDSLQNAFNLDSAVGVQLDTLGKYAGVTRYTYDFSGAVTLDDEDFRQLIYIAIVRNSLGSSLSDIQTLLNTYFPGTLLVFDYANMHMDYFFSSEIGSQTIAEVFVRQDLLPRPMGVQLGALIYAPTIDNFFGFGTYENDPYNVHGFNTYEDYETDCPWIDSRDYPDGNVLAF